MMTSSSLADLDFHRGSTAMSNEGVVIWEERAVCSGWAMGLQAWSQWNDHVRSLSRLSPAETTVLYERMNAR